MAKIARNKSTGQFTVSANGKGSPATIRDSQSGRALPLKGYGALKGEFTIRKGMNLSKPIAAQAAKPKRRKAPAAKATQA
jgi:hypothetical protein